jgi:molybdopterin-guanine dinucleotide biosynthesis protein B
MKVFGFTGWSGSGKTTLLTAVLPHLSALGLRIATVKHAHHEFDLDQPGKDSWRHRAAGAREVLIASGRRWALLHENEGPEPDLDTLLARLSPTDLVLVEGFKSSPHPKLEVHRPSLDLAPIWPGRDDIVAVATDEPLGECPCPVLPLADPACIAGWIVAFLGLNHLPGRSA